MTIQITLAAKTVTIERSRATSISQLRNFVYDLQANSSQFGTPHTFNSLRKTMSPRLQNRPPNINIILRL